MRKLCYSLRVQFHHLHMIALPGRVIATLWEKRAYSNKWLMAHERKNRQSAAQMSRKYEEVMTFFEQAETFCNRECQQKIAIVLTCV